MLINSRGNPSGVVHVTKGVQQSVRKERHGRFGRGGTYVTSLFFTGEDQVFWWKWLDETYVTFSCIFLMIYPFSSFSSFMKCQIPIPYISETKIRTQAPGSRGLRDFRIIAGLFIRVGWNDDFICLSISSEFLASRFSRSHPFQLHGFDRPIVNGPIWLGIRNRPSHGPSLPCLLGFFGLRIEIPLSSTRSTYSILPIFI